MIDFHAHILPGMDDGSKNTDESLRMLKSLSEQHVTTVIATPHFYANDESVDEFLRRRNKSYQHLMEHTSGPPRIIPGAEVRYYDGISHLEDLHKLRIEGTRFLLLEMPFNRWTEYAERELMDIAGSGNFTLVLAHIDRYLPFVKEETINRLLFNGVLFQANASFFDGIFRSRKAVNMLIERRIHFLGTDCHNMDSRAPDMIKALQVIRKKIGDAAIAEYLKDGNNLFRQNQINQIK